LAQLKLENLRKRFAQGPEAVAGIDLEVEDGEFLAVVGPSGSGKTTLLRLIAGLEEPTVGVIRLGNRRVESLSPRDRDVALMIQEEALYPHLNAMQNLVFGLRARGLTSHEIEERLRQVVPPLGLDSQLELFPNALSGGERRRIALGRALVRRPAVCLLDEPLSHLDGPLRLALRSELVALQRRTGTTMLLVTHDQLEAMAIGERVAVILNGRIAQVGPQLEVYRRPINQFVAEFFSPWPSTFLPCQVSQEQNLWIVHLGEAGPEETTTIRVPAQDQSHWPRPGRAILGLRPEDVEVGEWPDGLAGVVSQVEWLGHQARLILSWRGRNVQTLVDVRQARPPGSLVRFRFRWEHSLWFDPDSGDALSR
jgi:ABC-type sugar transport system ATPase subunit